MRNDPPPFSMVAAVKGAVAGGIAVLIESVVVAIPFMSGSPSSQAEAEAMAAALMESSPYLLTDLVASLLCMALGGFVAAGSAGHSGVKHGAAAGAMLLLVVAASAALSPQGAPGWYTAAALLLIVPAASLGGSLRGV